MHHQLVIQISITYYELDFSFLIAIHGTMIPLGIPIYRYNYQACQYDGGTITNFPTNQYPEPIEWINLSQYHNFVYNQIIEEKWPLELYLTEIERRLSTQSRSNDINIGHHYMPPYYSKFNLSSSLESTLSTETGYNPPMKSK